MIGAPNVVFLWRGGPLGPGFRGAAMKTGILSAVLAAGFMVASGVEAATAKFELNWSAASGTSTTDPSMSVTGLLELAPESDGSFDESNIISLIFSVTGRTIELFTLDFSDLDPDTDLEPSTPGVQGDAAILDGQVSDDGKTAKLTDFLFSFYGSNGFGCDFEDCERDRKKFTDPFYNIVSGRQLGGNAPNGNRGTTLYASASDALSSISLTRLFDDPDPVDPDPIGPDPVDPDPGNDLSPIPLPASAPLLLGALAGLALWRRRWSV